MKLPVIKKLVKNYDVAQLQDAEQALLEDRAPAIEIEGDDEGEQLTHVFAAVWILNKMETDGLDENKALRAYTEKVRNSIS